jgi:CubicO group peptidase (beta-lactamase class C family)
MSKISEMELLVKRLNSIRLVIEQILLISGTVGLSYGVLYHRKVAHTASFGYRDHEKKLPVNKETISPLCSLTKAMVAAAVGSLVEDGKIN